MARVLVVDDDADIRDMLRLVLTDEGHEVAEAADGEAGLDFLRATPLRWIVLLDYWLPGLDGRAVLEAVAADESLARQHAYIAVSANSLSTRPSSRYGRRWACRSWPSHSIWTSCSPPSPRRRRGSRPKLPGSVNLRKRCDLFPAGRGRR
jgi:CheY-like chemotaxis protein